MISLIICSRSSKAAAEMRENVALTIGVPYELIVIDNSQKIYGICEAYNVGAQQAQYELLCFMHEDIKFHTVGWGKVVADILADATIGVVGVAGSTHQLHVPAAWWWSGEQHQRMNIRHSPPGMPSSLDIVNPTSERLVDAAVLDGVWLCSRKAVWQQFPFDQQTFLEFHFYDIDYCTSLYPAYRICVTYDVAIEHCSLGSVNEIWLQNAIKYQHKWRTKLPFGPAIVAKTEEKNLERNALISFLQLLVGSSISKTVKLYYLRKLFSYSPITRDYFWLIKKAFLSSRSAQS